VPAEPLDLNALAQLQLPYVPSLWLITLTVLGLVSVAYQGLIKPEKSRDRASQPPLPPDRSPSSTAPETNPTSLDSVRRAFKRIKTERDQAQDNLQRIKTQFEGLADNLPGVIYQYEVTPAGAERFTYVSPGCKDLYGLDPEAVMQNPKLMWDAVSPEDIASLQSTIEHSKKNMASWLWQGRIHTPGGTVKWVQGIATLHRQPNGTLCWDGLLMDISSMKQVEFDLKHERDLFDGVVTTSVAAVVVFDTEGRFVFVNPRAEKILGQPASYLLGHTCQEYKFQQYDEHGIPLPFEQTTYGVMMVTGQSFQNKRITLAKPDSSRVLLTVDGSPVRNSRGEIKNYVCTFDDISAQVQAELALKNSEALLRLVTDNMRDLVCLHDPDGTYRYVSPSARLVLGFDPTDMMGQNPYDFFHPEDRQRIRLETHSAVLEGTPQGVVYRMRTRSGNYVWLETLAQPIINKTGVVTQLQTSSRDVTERINFLARLEYEAHHDMLTGLPNRKQFLKGLDQVLAECSQAEQLCGILFVDLDRFKVINDGLGHQVGDQVLVAMAQKLKAHLPPQASMARLSGDEFIILLERMHHPQEAITLAEQLLAAFGHPLSLKDWEIFISASIGIVVGPASYLTGAEMLRDAEIALYRAKTSGKSCYTLFEPQMHANVVRQMHLEHALRRSIEHRDFVLHYQPIVNLQTRQLCGFEALLRWQHQKYGMISPLEFIPIAEETGLIIPLGNWVLQTACTQFRQWQQRFKTVESMALSVNLSPVQVRSPDLIDQLQTAIDQSGIPSTNLTLEITESLLVENVEHNLAILRRIRQMGPKLSMDDFGTGYSSLSYFQRFPFDCMKVDRSFVAHLGNRAENPNLVKAILALTDSLDLEVIAEGIETEQQLEFLHRNRCLYGQGFLFYRPMPAEQVEDLLASLEG
jgi:diguanylate cyclase (GGDEF)-like protein/PAS domain S-box-containing protein